MNREEIIKAFEENYFIATDGTVKIYADDLVEIFTKHEQDTLKEFVEYCKNDCKDGDEEAIKTINCWLNLLLENFIKEREK